jgi:predicted  nucleic acid-binding Zn-ribbon protein
MNENPALSTGNPALDMDALCASINRVTGKIQTISEAVKNLNENKEQLEGKIEDAHKRVQRILSRLPEQSDGRQLNLLGEAIPPNNPEDDNEPTTH